MIGLISKLVYLAAGAVVTMFAIKNPKVRKTAEEARDKLEVKVKETVETLKTSLNENAAFSELFQNLQNAGLKVNLTKEEYLQKVKSEVRNLKNVAADRREEFIQMADEKYEDFKTWLKSALDKTEEKANKVRDDAKESASKNSDKGGNGGSQNQKKD